MRLYLSSYQIGRRGDVFAALVGGQRRGRVISNALDGYDEERRGADTRRQIEQLAQLGLEATELDLRQHDPDTIAREVGSRTSCGSAEATSSRRGWRWLARVWTS
ncbi:hypothetical protein [Brachybacterium tyrofermentans]|uniref:hypothetical protein n=1 Tax=Brachybacterium tyrofermentans TaxID=47848 RepID=UPI003FD5ECA1